MYCPCAIVSAWLLIALTEKAVIRFKCHDADSLNLGASDRRKNDRACRAVDCSDIGFA